MESEEVKLPKMLKFDTSPTIGELVGALAKARKQFKPVIKEATNPFFKSKYADLAVVIDATKDGLSDNGLAVLQPPAFERSTGTVEVLTLLAHSSGEWIRCSLDMPTSKGDAQGVGSAITYGRRYAYSAMVNVASEEDDDGNAAVSGEFKRKAETEQAYEQRTELQTCISPMQQRGIQEACQRTNKTEDEIKAYLGLIGHQRIEHILKAEFNDFLKWANSTGKPPKPNGKDVTAMPSKANPNTVKAFDHAWQKLYGDAAAKGIPQEDIKRYYTETYKVESGTQLTPFQFKEVVEWVQQQA